MTIDNLIKVYIGLAKNCHDVDYADKRAVRRNNDSAKRMGAIVGEINDKFGTDGIRRFNPVLDITDYKTNLWAAVHLLKIVDNLDKSMETKALGIIKKVAAGDDLEALGFKYWIKDWELSRRK
jgi:hypothetical protein